MPSTHLRHVKGNLDVTHGTKIVNFSGLDVGNNGDKVGGIAKIPIVKEEFHTSLMAVTVDVVNTASVE
jgi:hypothetical protein